MEDVLKNSQEGEEHISTRNSLSQKAPESEFKKEYEILFKIGNGAHASVHAVKKRKTGRQFCAKFIPYEELEDLFTAIYEYKIVRSLSHQSIIQFHEIFIDISGKEIVIICDYDEELKPLKYFLKKKIIISEEKLCQVMAQFFNALNYMHTQGVCHRDISVDNLLASDSSLTTVKIIDFGTAFQFKTVKKTLLDDLACKRSLEVKRMSARVGGKQSCMAPEMMNGLSYDQEVDTYSMCQVLLDCCSLIVKAPNSTSQIKKKKPLLKAKTEEIDQGISLSKELKEDNASSTTKADESTNTESTKTESPLLLESKKALQENGPMTPQFSVSQEQALSAEKPFSDTSLFFEKESAGLKEKLKVFVISPELKDFLERGLDSKRELRLAVKEALYHPWLSSKSKNRRPKTKMYTQEVTRPGESRDIQDNNWVYEEMSLILDQLTKTMTEYKGRISPELIEKGRKNGIFIQP